MNILRSMIRENLSELDTFSEWVCFEASDYQQLETYKTNYYKKEKSH